MTDEIREAQQVHASTRQLIDTLGCAGLPERVIVPSMHLAVVERLLVSQGREAAQRFLRDQADQLDEWGDQFLTLLTSRI